MSAPRAGVLLLTLAAAALDAAPRRAAAAAEPTLLAAPLPPCSEWAALERLARCLGDGLERASGDEAPGQRAVAPSEPTRHGEDVAVVTVGRAPSPWQRSFYLALRRGERWQAVAELGVETRAGVGGGWEELTVESVERMAAPGGAVVRIDVRHGFRDRDLRTGAELSFVETRATLCWLPEAPAEAATCPLQVPVAREREELRPDGPEVPERLATRLEIRSGADPRRLEIVLVEGAAAGLEPFLGRHELP